MTAVYAAKGLEGVEWPNCGKFDWKTFHIFNNRLHSADDITDVSESYDYLFAQLETGSLKIFRNPAGKDGQ